MRKYLIQSAALHAFVLGAIFLSPFFRGQPQVYWVDSFDFNGGGGGGGGSSGPKAAQMGQVVPQPVKMAVPNKPAPIQHEIRGEETWKVKKPNEIKRDTKPQPPVDESVERGEKAQTAQSNIIRRGVPEGAKAGDGSYDFGNGQGGGAGIGIGFGDGEGAGGFGFGSYLRLLRERIWSEWTQSAVIGSKLSCVVGLTVAMNGETSSIRLEQSSGNAFYDNVALRAVRNATVPPLPVNFPRSSQRFNLQFRLQD